jgi:hypothetical protein
LSRDWREAALGRKDRWYNREGIAYQKGTQKAPDARRGGGNGGDDSISKLLEKIAYNQALKRPVVLIQSHQGSSAHRPYRRR